MAEKPKPPALAELDLEKLLQQLLVFRDAARQSGFETEAYLADMTALSVANRLAKAFKASGSKSK